MRSVIIPASKSLTISNKFPDSNINDDTIMVGYAGKYEYSSLLFFDFSSIPDNISLISSELVLFKCDNFYNNSTIFFDIYPLYDYFSSFTTYSNAPNIKHFIRKSLFPFTSKVSVTSNITDMFSLWSANTIGNRGLAICSQKNNPIATFGSAKSNDNYLIPFIKVTFETNKFETNRKDTNCEKKDPNPENCCNKSKFNFVISACCKGIISESDTGTIVQVEVTGTVQPHSIFVVIIEVTVTRASGIVNKYYATDEYDNSLNDTPMDVDKTYDIAVVPKISAGDTISDVKVYGSYKV